MEKRHLAILVSFQALLCLLASYLVSKISLIGKVGIAIFYKEYRLLRSGWKTFLLFFCLQLIVILLMWFMSKKYPVKRTVYTASVIIIISLLGFFTTYNDFLHTYSHRLLKERFHTGFYLFWIGIMITCAFFIFIAKNKTINQVEASVTEENI